MSESTEGAREEESGEATAEEEIEQPEITEATEELTGEVGTGESEADVMFRQLLEIVLAKMDEGIDDLLALQKAIQRFGAMSTLLIMHMLLDAVRESAPVPASANLEPLALKWIEDNAHSYAEELMNEEVIAATAKVIGSPTVKLQFNRAFRRRLLGFH